MRSFNFLLLLVLIGTVCFGVPAQSEEFTEPSGKYKLTLLADWRPISYNDAVGRSRTEFVYRDRSEGLLRITKESLGGRTLGAIVQDEEETSRMSRAGFDASTKEAFGGGPHQGMRLSFFYIESGRRMAATYYYFGDVDSVWMLKFNGKRGSIDTIRNLTDQIARSFRAL
ncbi:MAG TPA: hypothetical protein VFV34_05050 [Blastocatellia bacterium]|nr:hypothetical protein [Blastocatellia bacterium]